MTTATEAPLLRLVTVGLRRGRTTVLEAVDLELRPGELVALVGKNGAGKTSLLRVAAGVLAPTSGAIELLGAPLAGQARRAIAAHVAYLPQAEVGHDVELTVREVVALGRAPFGSAFSALTPVDLAAIDRAITDAGVEHLGDRALASLSAGERQRALLGRAFAHEARVLLLDEPTASLDPAGALALTLAVRSRLGETGAALVAMHDLFLVARAADRAVVLDGARIVADGPPEEVLSEAMLERAFGLRARLGREGEELVLRVRAE